MSGEVFIDTNVLLYLLAQDPKKADTAESILADGGTISVQVLNEFASVAHRKFGMSYAEIRSVLFPIQELCTVVPVHSGTHADALWLAERYRLNLWDALILASALDTDCAVLYTEDLQHGQIVEDRLRIANPFATA